MKISKTGPTTALRRAGRLTCLAVVAGAMLMAIGARPALAQRDEQRFQTAQHSEDRHDERRTPPARVKQRPRAYHGYYEAPRYVYAPPPVLYAPPSGLEFVFPLTFR
jgi:hypothetical protein